MNKVYLNATVSDDGSLTIPAFAVRGLGYAPGEDVNLALPTEMCAAVCDDSELLIKRTCGDYDDGGNGYTTEGDDINLPAKLLQDSGVPLGSEISVLASEGMLIIAGYDPELVQTVSAALPF